MVAKKIDCPLMEIKIDEGTCFDIHMNVEGLAPDWTVPEKILKVMDFKEKCLKCPNHRDD